MHAEDKNMSNQVYSPKRSETDRRSGFDNRGLKAIERECLRMCKAAGVKFSGVQSGFGVTADLCLFSNRHGSTLALPVDSVTVIGIMKRVLESEGAWSVKKAA
jgi:hypothetical protein